MRVSSGTIVIAGAAALIALAWTFWWRSDDRAIRRELANLAADANAPVGEGVGAISWAAALGRYFTDDVVIDAGAAAGTPIAGRHAVIGMATRFHPRLAGVTVAIDDVSVQTRAERGIAEVTAVLTWTFADARSRESMDARELALEMKKDGGRWRISRVTADDVLR